MYTRRRIGALRFAAVASVGAWAACAPSVTPPYHNTLAEGIWGADGAGLTVADSMAHVHIGCTNGDFRVPDSLQDGRFDVAGNYVLRAYPVAIGPPVPARFAGAISGNSLRLTVTVDDTVEHRVVSLGPVTLQHGREPRMGPCPICRPGRVVVTRPD